MEEIKKNISYLIKWKINGFGLSSIIIEADSFDNAINFARKINPMYCEGRVVSDNDISNMTCVKSK